MFMSSSLCLCHSLTHCCAWPAEVVASSTSNDPGPRSRQHQQIGQCLLPLAAANFSGGRSQSAAGGVPVWASIDSWSACEAGVFSGRRQMWPNNEWRLSEIRDVLSLTTALDTLSYHLISRIRRSACMWKDWILSLSTLRILSTFQNHITLLTAQEYILSLVERLSSAGYSILRAFAQRNLALFRNLRNRRVNRVRKSLQRQFFLDRVEKLKSDNPSRWCTDAWHRLHLLFSY